MTIGTHGLTLERALWLSYTRSYIQHNVIFAFAESNIFQGPLERLMAPFQSSVWISISILVVISTVVILLTKQLPRQQRHFIIGGYMNRTPIINMINGVIGNVISNRRMLHRRYFGTFARTLTLLWVLFWFIVRNAYQGSLYDHFQSHRTYSPYDTVEKVRNSNVTIYMFNTAVAIIPDVFDKRR